MAEVDADVVVVGGGPAGSTAAYYIHDKTVLIIDAKDFPRHKACGGGLLNSRDWPNVFDNFAEIENELHIHPLENINIYWGDKPIFSRPGPIGDHVRRLEFDNLLLKAALRKGNVTYRRFQLHSITQHKDRVILSDRNENIVARYVVGCDGWNSKVARSLGNASLIPRQYGTCLEYDIACTPIKNVYVMLCWQGQLGYAWVFPTSDGCYAGVGFVGSLAKPAKKYLDEFVDFCVRQEVIPSSCAIRRTFGAPDPVFVARDFAKGNIVLAGDAMGLVKQISGEGIYFAMLSGKIAGQTTNSGGDVAGRYAELMRPYVKEVTVRKNIPPKFLSVPALKVAFLLMQAGPWKQSLQKAFLNRFCRRYNLPLNSHYIPY